MKIKSVTVSNFGPFYEQHMLELDPCVTVLTGPNDSGKSILLDALGCAVLGQNVRERRVNYSRNLEVPPDNLAQLEMYVDLRLEVNRGDTDPGLRQRGLQPGDVVTIRRFVDGRAQQHGTTVERDGKPISVAVQFPEWKLLRLPGPSFRQNIPINDANEVERDFLAIGLGPHFASHAKNPPRHWPETLRIAEEKITAELARLLPAGMPMGVRMSPGTSERPGTIRVSLKDRIGDLLGVDDRGAGIGKILGFVGPLVVALRNQRAPLLLLIDEPETSLHADLQHRLRALLEEIGKGPMCQVVYATHSPSMINNMRPESIRLLSRGTKDGQPSSLIKNDAFDKSFAAVRSTLGLSPADSLLYAPVTVVVEGKTEVLCLPRMMAKLSDAGLEGFKDVGDLLEQIHFLEGEGDSVEYFVRLAKSQNNKVVVFLDGETRPKAGEKKLAANHSEVTVIKLGAKQDIEQLVPTEVYLRAVVECCREVAPDDAGKISQEAFDEWLSRQLVTRQRLLFGRQVQDWLEDTLEGEIPKKHCLLAKAVDICDAKDIRAEKLLELIDAIRPHLQKTGSA